MVYFSQTKDNSKADIQNLDNRVRFVAMTTWMLVSMYRL